METKKKGFSKFLLIVIVIGIIVYFISRILPYYHADASNTGNDRLDYEDCPQHGFVLYDAEEEIAKETEDEKNTESDLKGISVYEKKSMGLNPWDNSDTDADGLTDKEEIEEYGTDPLKCSSSGDFYPDGYKVENNMDLNKYYEYDDELTVSDKNGVVTISAKTPYDLGLNERSSKDKGCYVVEPNRKMYVSDYTNQAEKEASENAYYIHGCSTSFYKAYQIGYYDGDEITVDLEPIATELGVDANELDAEAYSSYHDVMNKKRRHNIISFKTKHEHGHTDGQGMLLYEIYITDKETIIDKLTGDDNKISFSSLFIVEKTQEIFDEESAYSGLIVACPRASFYLGLPPVVFCSKTANEAEKRGLLNYSTIMWQSVYYGDSWKELPEVTEEFIIYTDYQTIKKYYLLLKHFFGPERVCTDGILDRVGVVEPILFACANDYTQEISKALGDIKKMEEQKAKFGLGDEFSFGNFATPYLDTNNQGVCAGLAMIASEVYNNGKLKEPVGEYEAKITVRNHSATQKIKYDISDVEECKTFFDRYIRDYYKDYSRYNKKNATQDEKEFVKMVSCYWKKTNDQINERYSRKDFCLTKEDDKVRMVTWDSIEKAVEYLDKRKTLLWAFNVNNQEGAGHFVNLVGYHRSVGEVFGEEKEVIAFDVYDTNFPQELKIVFCYKMETTNGKGITFFEYRPSIGEYETSFMLDDSKDVINGNNDPLFAILDEDLNMVSDLVTVTLE